ncbi:GMC family oxidoreductase N-terminal domain-containing protein [Sinorhizobium meliloti]
MTKTRYNWAYVSEPESGLKGRSVDEARRKVLGGSSSIDGMTYSAPL